ncbi:hypothetical protein LTS18_002345, partial [Coniosporium uncinatum]
MHFNSIKQAVALAACMLPSAFGQASGGTNGTTAMTPNTEFNAMRTMSVGFVVVPGWEILDVFGPLEILFSLSYFNKMTLSIISPEVGLVPAGVPPHSFAAGFPKTDYGYVLTPQIQSTHTFANAPALDILFVAGGFGVVALDQENSTIIEDFIINRFPRVEYIVGISLGVVPMAKAGILNGKRATTNKSAWSYVTTGHGSNISWVPTARWVQDGKVWTSSGVAAGKAHHPVSKELTERLDTTYALLKYLYGPEPLDTMMNVIEYAPHTNPSWDPYAVVYN